jgi:hypothetical protein
MASVLQALLGFLVQLRNPLEEYTIFQSSRVSHTMLPFMFAE